MRGTWAHEVDFSIELGAPPPSEEWIKGQLYKSIADYCQEFCYLLNCSFYPTSRYHTNFMLSIFSYMFVETHKTSGRFLYRKTVPASCYGNRGGSLCFIRAFSSPHAITCGGSWSQPGRVPKLQSVGSNDDTLFVNFQCVLPHLRNDLLQIFFLQIEFRQFCLVI